MAEYMFQMWSIEQLYIELGPLPSVKENQQQPKKQELKTPQPYIPLLAEQRSLIIFEFVIIANLIKLERG